MSNGTMFQIRTANGIYEGRVQGAGGEVGCAHAGTRADRMRDVQRMNIESERAGYGKPFLRLYEPKPGHVKLYLGAFKPSDAEETVLELDIRGADFALAV